MHGVHDGDEQRNEDPLRRERLARVRSVHQRGDRGDRYVWLHSLSLSVCCLLSDHGAAVAEEEEVDIFGGIEREGFMCRGAYVGEALLFFLLAYDTGSYLGT